MTNQSIECIECHENQTSGWTAWNNLMPIGPGTLIVVGQVVVGNPGIDVKLIEPLAPGINPTILILDILLCQQPGNWPEIETNAPARFERPHDPLVKQVSIRCGSEIVATVDVFDTH